jgi:hypothetical protein
MTGRAALVLLAACAAWAQDAVVRHEGMQCPRKRLRYRGRLGETQPLRLEMWQELRRESEEGGTPLSQNPSDCHRPRVRRPVHGLS